jgi:hypothetical protein
LSVLAVEPIFRKDLNGQAVGILNSITTLWSLASFRILGLRGQSDVMINELAPENQENGDSVVMEAIICVDSSGTQPG